MNETNEGVPILLGPAAEKPKTKPRARKKVEGPANLPTGETNNLNQSTNKVARPRDEGEPAHQQSFLRKWGSLIVLSLALAIIIIDTTILNVSFSTILKDLNTDIQSMQWVITAYALMLAAFTITGGRFGDIFGKKKMFILGAIIFAIGSFVASVSPNITWLIIGESIIEGVGAALMLPATASLLLTNFTGRDRAIAFGVWGGVAAASSAIGPIIGGFLTTNYSWRWAFRVNLFVVALLVASSFLIKSTRTVEERARSPKLDDVGIILSAIGLLSIVFGIIESSTYGWWKAKKVFTFGSHSLPLDGNLSIVVPALAYGLIVLAIFFWWERYTERKGNMPLVSLSIFRNRQFTTGALTTGMMTMSFAGIIFSVPIFLQAVRNLDAIHTGLALLPMSLGILITAPLSAVLGHYIRPRRLVQFGFIINIIGLSVLYLSLNVNATVWTLAPGLGIFGLGMGFIFSQLNNITLSAVSAAEGGEAAGLNNTLRQLGQTLGSAIIGAVLISSLSTNLTQGVQASNVIPAQAKNQLASAISSQTSQVEFGTANVGNNLPPNIKNEITNISHQATVDGNREALVYSILFTFWAFIFSFSLPNVNLIEGKSPIGH
jgi:EmrB/QacA subfamily drug resistance transporter